MKANDKSLDLVKENIKKLEQIFPEAVSDGMLDFDMLKALMGGGISSSEKYGLNWFGKEKTINNYFKPTTNTLRYDEANSDKNSNNIYIKADNLEALKLLQKSYFEKIKMIYIDPPYNTGKDFVYKDNFNDTLKAYKEQLSNITTNTNTDGRFHSNWLNMMYPRLRLAKNLLRDDGVIFISIDDNESAQLKLLCDEIFGRDNFVSQFIWKCRNSLQQSEPLVSTQTEFILCYCKDKKQYGKDLLRFNRVRKPFDDSGYSNPDNDPRGAWLSSGKTRNDGRQSYTVVSPTGKEFTMPWIPSPEEFKKWEDEKLIWWGIDGNAIPRKKSFLKDFKGNAISNILFDEYTDEIKNGKLKRTKRWEVGTTENGGETLKEFFEFLPFDYPKPHTLIKYLLQISTDKDDIVLDFFSGSATTAHAVMQLNALDGGNRKYILIQIPEPTEAKSIAYQNGYKNICEIGLTRIKKSSEKIKQDYPNASFDDGVKIFYLDSSNLSTWDGENITQENLFTKLEKIKQDRVGLDLVYEFILKQGYSLTSKIEYKNDKYFVKDDDKQMIICLKKSDFNELLKYKDSEIIIEDDLLDDDFKLNILNNLKNAKTF